MLKHNPTSNTNFHQQSNIQQQNGLADLGLHQKNSPNKNSVSLGENISLNKTSPFSKDDLDAA